MFLISIITFFLALISEKDSVTAEGLYPASGNVINLNQYSFKRTVLETTDTFLVEFYAPWCGHCKRLAPEFMAAAKHSDGLVKFAAIDCDDASNKPICGQYNVRGFPTIKLFTVSESTKRKGQPVDYNGGRDAASMLTYVNARVPSFVLRVTAQDEAGGNDQSISFDDFIGQRPETPKALLFTERDKTTALYRGLSVNFPDVFIFGQVHGPSQPDLCRRLGVTDFPTLIAFPAGASKDEAAERFSAAISYANVRAFLRSVKNRDYEEL